MGRTESGFVFERVDPQPHTLSNLFHPEGDSNVPEKKKEDGAADSAVRGWEWIGSYRNDEDHIPLEDSSSFRSDGL